MKPIITIAVQCHNFQRRFAWMLSSLADQTHTGLVAVDVAFLPGNGSPTTEALVDFFSSRINIRSSRWEDRERFQFRGLVRNRQLQECESEWLMFADCDMAYSQEYFQNLASDLETHHKGATYMLSSGRMSNPKELTNALIDGSIGNDPVFIPNSFSRADMLPKIEKSNVGAGFCQIINVKSAPHDGYYVKPGENRDWSWDSRGSNPKSDMQFRRRIASLGGPRRALGHWFTQNAIHLNHDRDPDFGKHLEHQR